MPTSNQLIKGCREKKKKSRRKLALAIAWNSRRRSFSLKNSPQKKGVCKKIVKLTPKKPNSAMRSCARVSLINSKKEIMAYIPGEGHNLQDYSMVYIQGGGAKDLGVQYSITRGRGDAAGVEKRQQGRSLYGAKRTLKSKEKK